MGREGAERRQEALIQAGLTLGSELSLPSVLQKIVKLACDVTDARYGALGVLSARNATIEAFITHGVTEEERRAIGHIPVGKGILGALITDATPLRLRRISDDPRSVGFPSNHPPMTSFLGVPVLSRGRVYGNLYLTEKRGASEFTEEDERSVVTLAAQAGVAIENAHLYEEARHQQERSEATAEVTRAILEGVPLDDVLQLIARSARSLLDADLSSIAVPDPSGGLVVRAADGERAPRISGTRFPAEGSISGHVMRTGRPQVIEDARGDPRAHQPVVQLGDMGPLIVVPLAAGSRSFGTLSIANRSGGRPFENGDLALAGEFGVQASVALDYTNIRDDLYRLAVLEDRERIAKELHDGVVQSLFAVGMALQSAEHLAGDPEAVKGRVRDSIAAIDGAIRDLRGYIFGLGPSSTDGGSIDGALRGLTEEFQRGSDVGIRLEVDRGSATALAASTPDIVQAVREAISNAIRHGDPATVSVTLMPEDGGHVLEVEDDGSGFDVGTVRPGGRGLANLRARAESLGGTFQLTSEPGTGTTLRIRIPLHPS